MSKDALYIVHRPIASCESALVFTTVHNGPIEVTQIPKLTEIVDLVSRDSSFYSFRLMTINCSFYAK